MTTGSRVPWPPRWPDGARQQPPQRSGTKHEIKPACRGWVGTDFISGSLGFQPDLSWGHLGGGHSPDLQDSFPDTHTYTHRFTRLPQPHPRTLTQGIDTLVQSCPPTLGHTHVHTHPGDHRRPGPEGTRLSHSFHLLASCPVSSHHLTKNLRPPFESPVPSLLLPCPSPRHVLEHGEVGCAARGRTSQNDTR